MAHTTSGAEYVPGAHTVGNARRMALLYWIRRMLQNPKMGSRHDGQKWVFASAQEASVEVNCNRKTAHDDLKWLADNGFLIREKLGGRAMKPCGTRVSLGNRSWFYRLGDKLPSWFMELGNPSPTQRAVHRPVTGQSETKDGCPGSSFENQPGCGKKQPNSPKRKKGWFELQQHLEQRYGALAGIQETDSEYQQRIWKESQERKAREDRIYSRKIPAGTGFGGN